MRSTHSLALKDLAQVLPYDARRLRSVDRFPDALPLVVLDNRPSLLMERSKAFAERLNVVVRTLDERLAGHVVSHWFLWGAVEAARVCGQ